MTSIETSPEPFPELLITLASASPRRRELLDQIQVSYAVHPANIDETHIAGETAEQFVKRLAQEKARFVIKELPERPVLSADTIIILEGQILGKPESLQHAKEILNMLSGRTHQVMTAVAINDGEVEHVALNSSEVEFAYISDKQIDAYLKTGESQDKAGAYGIQGLAGQFIKNINGSYSSIMGLPLYETTELLKLVGIEHLK